MPRATVHTLGCKLNYAESSTLTRDLEALGYACVPFGEPADVTIINTCSVTDEADRKCRQSIRRALRFNPGAFLVVTGCYAQLKPDEIARIPGVDLVLGAREKAALPHYLAALDKREQPHVAVSCIGEATRFQAAFSSAERTRAFLKVQDGCDYGCSFCTIPLARGRSRSADPAEIVAQARRIAALGRREIVLSGVNIGLFGADTGASLLDLLRALDAVEGIARYRISSIEPNLLTPEIIRFVAASGRFMPHFHIPLQSGDDHVLGKMRRRYRRELYADRLAEILAAMPHACVGADVIVGFPAETEAHFENTRAFIEDLPLAYLHVFTYSERRDTVAVDRPDLVGEAPPPAERSRRNRALRLLSDRKRRAFYGRFLGEARPVLWEADHHDGRMHGFTDNYIRVSRPYDERYAGRIETVRLADFEPDGSLAAADADLPMLA